MPFLRRAYCLYEFFDSGPKYIGPDILKRKLMLVILAKSQREQNNISMTIMSMKHLTKYLIMTSQQATVFVTYYLYHLAMLLYKK